MLKDIFLNRLFIGALAFFVLCVGGSLLYMQHDKQKGEAEFAETQARVDQLNAKQKEQVSAKAPVGETSQGGHMHADGTWHGDAHTEETRPNGDGYDWRDDSTLEYPSPTNDPWKHIYPKDKLTSAADDTYPPRDWYKTEDPELFFESFRAQLIKQFGDIPAVHIVAEREKKRKMRIPVTLDEQILFLEAQYRLWNNKDTLKILTLLRKAKEDGHHREH